MIYKLFRKDKLIAKYGSFNMAWAASEVGDSIMLPDEAAAGKIPWEYIARRNPKVG